MTVQVRISMSWYRSALARLAKAFETFIHADTVALSCLGAASLYMVLTSSIGRPRTAERNEKSIDSVSYVVNAREARIVDVECYRVADQFARYSRPRR